MLANCRFVSAARAVPRHLAFLATLCVAFLLAGTAGKVSAQSIQLRVVDSTTMLPLNGALVALLDRQGAVVAEALSSAAGFPAFTAPAGSYRVRVRRIGYRPYVSDMVELSGRRALTIVVQSEPVVLSTIVISARTSCRSLGSARSQALATVWGEATKALEASRLTLADLEGIGRAWTYTKTVGVGDEEDRSDTTYFTVVNQRPFGAIDPDVLASGGYVVGNAEAGWSYYGADETVLLSPSFARTHCFRLVRERGQPGLIGVSFEPVRGRKTADIAGIVWLDQATSELRRMVFRYVNAGLISEHGGGGETHFLHLPSGAWLISSWRLRAPVLEYRIRGIRPIGFQENGGGLLHPG
ncbi:hypothetical protein BH23GEM1_BH23GEM1_10550 [soil metagenome]